MPKDLSTEMKIRQTGILLAQKFLRGLVLERFPISDLTYRQRSHEEIRMPYMSPCEIKISFGIPVYSQK